MSRRPSAASPAVSASNASASVGAATGQPGTPHHGQGGPDEESRGTGLGAVVHDRGVVAAVVQRRHRHRRKHGGAEDAHQQGQRAALEQPQQPEEDQRPHQVELLFDRQRPQMDERRRPPDVTEIRHFGEGQIPVGEVEAATEELALELADQARVEEEPPGRHHSEHQVQGGEKSAGPAHPEALQIDRVGVAVLAEQDGGDQVTADDEKHLDAEKSALDP